MSENKMTAISENELTVTRWYWGHSWILKMKMKMVKHNKRGSLWELKHDTYCPCWNRPFIHNSLQKKYK